MKKHKKKNSRASAVAGRMVTLPLERVTSDSDSYTQTPDDLPVIVTREAPGIYRAEFGFRLFGATRPVGSKPQDEAEAERPAWLGRLARQMDETDRVDLVFRRDAAKSLEILLIGKCTSNRARNAEQKAQELLIECRTLLSTQDECVFVPFDEMPGRSRDSRQTYVAEAITPRGLLLGADSKRSVGFEDEQQSPVSYSPHPVGLPVRSYDSRSFRDEFLKLMVNSPFNIELVITLSKRTLTNCELDLLETVAIGLDQNRLSPTYGWGSGRLVAANRETVSKWASEELRWWLASGTGYGLTCRLESSGPIPHALLETVSVWLFGSESTETACDSTSDAAGSPVTEIDLRNYFATSGPAPFLLPSAIELLNCGFPACQPGKPGDWPKLGIPIGYTNSIYQRHLVKLEPKLRDRHTYVVGATGTGKTTLLLNMILHDMQSGAGVIVLDPHGDLYQRALENIPLDRSGDVILIDPTDSEYVVGLNLMEGSNGTDALRINLIVNNLLEMMDKTYNLYRNGLAGPVWETYMRNAILLLLESDHPNPTLLDIVKLFENNEFRLCCKQSCRNRSVVSFFNEVAERAVGEASLRSIAAYVTSKLNRFTQNALLRPLIGLPEGTIDFQEATDQSRIILVNLSKGKLGGLDSQMLGFIVLSKIIGAIMSRCEQDVQSRRPTYLYVDEFQNLTSTDLLGQMLSECRKFGLSLILAHQHLGQLRASSGGQETLEALLGNIGSSIFFRLGAKDAELLQVYTKPEFAASDLQGMSDYTAVACLSRRHRPVRPQLLSTMPEGHVKIAADPDEVIRMARKYARLRTVVENELRELETATPVKDKKDQSAA